MKNISIKTIIFAFLALAAPLLAALVLSACDDILLDRGHSGGESPASGVPEGFGTITVSLSRGAGRTPIDDGVLDNLYLEYKFSTGGVELSNISPSEDGKFVLEPGAYTLKVNAYTDSKKETLIALGEAEFTISASVEADPVNITLYPATEGGGTGSLDFRLEYPSGGTVETLTLTPIVVDGNKLDLKKNGTSSTNEGTVTFAGKKEGVPAGYYLLRVELKNSGGAVTGRVRVVYIYPKTTTNADYTFSEDDFRFYRVTSNLDSGEGTLRDAITNAGAGQAIRIALEAPGNVIELTSSLTIDKNLTIEGNGVVLTRAASWTPGSTSRLVYVSGSDTVVNISRVHFKDGRATTSGAGIVSSGTLTLESCIFSGNQVTAAGSTYGGAIISTYGDLTIRACTFYGNSVTGDNIGAVSFSSGTGGALTLEGNLFSGNTAPSYPVVRARSGTIVASYNVTDTALGTGIGQTGFTETSDNTYYASLMVSLGSFKVLRGSAATGKLPATLPADYPTVDFYGNKISGGGQAGAVQAVTAEGKYYLGYSVNKSSQGSVSLSGSLDEDGLTDAGSGITLTASASGNYALAYWLKNGVKIPASGDTYSFTIDGHTTVQAVFGLLVTNFTDQSGSATSPGTLRYALTNSADGDLIYFSGVTPGITTVTLASALPLITKSLNIEGNGVTLTAGGAETHLLRITGTTAVVSISRVHFKDGYAYAASSNGGAAVNSAGTLTLESCIFSGNWTEYNRSRGGAVYNSGTATIRACTFYGNFVKIGSQAGNGGGAIGNTRNLTMTGNLFYKNTADYYPVASSGSGSLTASYNVVDVPFGVGYSHAGWTAGTGDTSSTDALLVFEGTFKIPYGTAAVGRLPTPLPVGYPTVDFYGQPISGGGAAGAVNTVTAQGKYYVGLSVNNPDWGVIESSPAPDSDGMVDLNSSLSLEAKPATGDGAVYSFAYWQRGDDRITTNPYPVTVSDHIPSIQAVFTRIVTVNDLSDGAGSAASPTLRYALNDAADGDTIRLTGVTPGVTTITLSTVLPDITKSITIEGNGMVLTRTFAGSSNTQLLRINSTTAVVNISRVHFKDGRGTNQGAAIYNNGTLTLESCVFSGNQNTDSYAYGGAVHSTGEMTIRACTFYGNGTVSTNANYGGGAVYFSASGKTLTMTGNLFYGSGGANPVVKIISGTAAPSYNVVDADFGTGISACGWTAGTGDQYSTDLLLFAGTFKIPSGTAAIGKLPGGLPAAYPTTDFYGRTISTGGQAGAVQDVVTTSGYFLGLSVNNPAWGTIESAPAPDGNGMVPAGSVTLTPKPATADGVEYSFAYWQKGDDRITDNPYTFTISTHIPSIQAVFTHVVAVSDLSDGTGSATTPGTLRYALTNAADGDTIRLTGVTPGTTEIALESVLPAITKSITIEGNGVTLKPGSSLTSSNNSQLLRITGTAAVVNISRVHFKAGRANDYGAGINSSGTLTLESCIFSDNQATDAGAQAGAINKSSGNLTIRGCTFYGNSTGTYGGGAIYMQGGALTLTGNLFYENTGGSYPVLRAAGGGSVTASYNVVDVALGANTGESGWAAGTGDSYSTDLLVFAGTFKIPSGTAAIGKLPGTTLPAGYPTKDFYGQTISAGGQAGAVQDIVTTSGYILGLSVNNTAWGTATSNPVPDGNSMVPAGSVTLTATPATGGGAAYVFAYWQKGDEQITDNPYTFTISAHIPSIQAVFTRVVAVSDLSDGTGSATTPGTLRYALTNAADGDTIRLTGVTPGTTEIALESVLPAITKSITIEGNGVTLKPGSSLTSSNNSQLFRITGTAAVVNISRVHFKAGRANDYGAGISNSGTLTLESCIFSDNKTSANNGQAGSINNSGNLNIRGCTFYGNGTSGSYGGGAIYMQGGALTLTGNLFYGNTGGSENNAYPVVHPNNKTVTGSYNVVDVALGASTGQSGWTAGTGDSTFSGLSIDTTTFVPVNDAALKVVPSGLTNFPATYFDGTARTFPGAPGAVKAAQ